MWLLNLHYQITNLTTLKLQSQFPHWNLAIKSFIIHPFRLTSAWPSMESPSGCVVEEQYCRSGLPGDLDCETSYLRESWLSQYSICMRERFISITNHINKLTNSKNLSSSMKKPLHSPITQCACVCVHAQNTSPFWVYISDVPCRC